MSDYQTDRPTPFMDSFPRVSVDRGGLKWDAELAAETERLHRLAEQHWRRRLRRRYHRSRLGRTMRRARIARQARRYDKEDW